jgi:FtsZ-binding cell division protein ZapB
MPDIVEQLRMLAGWRKEDARLLRRAADGIRRLRAEVEALRAENWALKCEVAGQLGERQALLQRTEEAEAEAFALRKICDGWMIHYDNLGIEPYDSGFMADWKFYPAYHHAEQIVQSMNRYRSHKHYSARPVRVVTIDVRR